MREDKKARPAGSTAGQAAGDGFEANNSRANYNTGGHVRQSGAVSSLLMTGEASAIPGKELAATLGLRDAREVSKLVERERRAGIPICASVSGEDRGYFLASGAAELERYIKSLDRRLKNVRETREAVQDTLNRLTEQTTLEG